MGCWILSSTTELGTAVSSLETFKRGQRPLTITQTTKNTQQRASLLNRPSREGLPVS